MGRAPAAGGRTPEPEGTAGGGVAWRVFGPPLAALRRAYLALRARMVVAFGRLSGFWRYLFLGPEPDEAGQLTPPTRSALLLASAILAVTLYSWPLRDILPPWLFIPLALVLLVVAHRSIQYASLRASGHRWERWLRESARRPGLVWWERVGALLGLGATGVALVVQWTLLPLTLGVLLGFVVLLGQPPRLRELRTLRVLPPLPPVRPPVPDGEDDEPESDRTLPDGYESRHFRWTTRHSLGEGTHELTLYLHEPTYREVKAGNPGVLWSGGVPQYASYVVSGTIPDIERAASALYALAQESRYSTYEEISLALSFVQAIPYSLDSESTGRDEYWRYPLETLYDQTGDCEDTTILGMALLRRLGHRVVGLDLPQHAALGVEVPHGIEGSFVLHEGRSFYYCETTANGWRVGSTPEHYRDADVTVVAIPPLDRTDLGGTG